MEALISAFGLGNRGFFGSIRVPLPGFRAAYPVLRLTNPINVRVTQAEIQSLFATELRDSQPEPKARRAR